MYFIYHVLSSNKLIYVFCLSHPVDLPLAVKVTSALVAVRHHQQRTGRGELPGDGLFNSDPLHDVTLRHHVHRLFQMEDEQRSRINNVPSLFCIRGRITNV